MRKTIYAKMTALPVGLCALAFAVTSCGSSEYKKFADNEGKQVASILRENDCLACHSENAPLPFYGNLPLIGPVVQADMKEARSLCGLDCYGGSLGERAARFRG